jgi:uncharacterized protein with NRDE domain
MCLVLFAYRVLDGYPLVVAANRDEFYARPAAPAHAWADAQHVFAGRDLTAQGTWLGVSTQRRFAAVTNFSDVNGAQPKPPASRGDLTRDFLTGADSAPAFAARIAPDRYQGFSLLLWDGSDLVYTSNRSGVRKCLPPGIHALANTHLDDDWPKTVRGKQRLGATLTDPPQLDALVTMLRDEYVPPDEALPERGRGVEFERRVAPIFIRGTEYGSRASTAVVFAADSVELMEQGYGPEGVPLARVATSLRLQSPD